MRLKLRLGQILDQARNVLDENVRDHISAYIAGEINEDGGFKARDGKSDLYYTWFGLQCMRAFKIKVPADCIGNYLKALDTENLDPVHTAAFIQCRIMLQNTWIKQLWNIMQVRSSLQTILNTRSVYETFLAYMTMADLGFSVFRQKHISELLKNHRTPDGGYSDQKGCRTGTTTVTAAACILHRSLGHPADPETGDWLLHQLHARGGFLAHPDAPLPVLLSTATALLAFSVLGVTLNQKQIADCWEFVETVWCENGGFSAHLLDEQADIEYTFYGLMCMGLLGRMSGGDAQNMEE